MKEIDGDYVHAISIYLDAGFPGKATLIISDKDIVHPQDLLESAATALIYAGLRKQSGDTYQRTVQFQIAMPACQFTQTGQQLEKL